MLSILAVTVALWTVCMVVARWIPRTWPWLAASAVLYALAGANALYYLHGWDDSTWYCRYRTAALSDHAPALSGLMVGYWVWTKRVGWRLLIGRTLLAAVAGIGVLLPWTKPLLDPLDYPDIENVVRDGIITQQSSSTCGPCAVAFILAQLGVEVSEGQLAHEAFTSGSGTELWYLARCVERRGLTVRFCSSRSHVEKDSVIGVTISGDGHFISLYEVNGERISIHDSMRGKRMVTEDDLRNVLHCSGMYMRISKGHGDDAARVGSSITSGSSLAMTPSP